MKYHHLLPLVALASAAAVASEEGRRQVLALEKVHSDSMWDSLPGRQDVVSSIEDMIDSMGQSLDHAVDAIARAGRRVVGSLLDGDDLDHDSRRRDHRRPCHGGRCGSHYGDSGDETVYEMIRNSRYARRFAKMIEEHDDLRKRLDDPGRDYTVFVPTDDAFEKFPMHEKPSKEFLMKMLEYHVVPETYTAGRIMSEHTIPTMLEERELGHREQRLRISVGLFGVHINFYSQIVASNIMASNGIIHAIDNVLIPPPRQGKLIDALPGKFSSFSLAMEKTGLGRDLHERTQRGGTVFAPTNNAWMRLGPKMNAFLFSNQGTNYLRALLMYHVVPNETLYSDAFYDEGRRHGRDDDDDDKKRSRNPSRLGALFEEEDVESLCEDCDGPSDGHRRRRHGDNKRHRHHRNRGDCHDGRDRDHNDDDVGEYDNELQDDLEALYSRRRNHKNRDHCKNGHCGRRHRSDERSDADLYAADESFSTSENRNVELQTMLKDRTVNVRVWRWMGLTSMKVNGRARVSVQDGVARDGVVQVVESVLMPPRRRRHNDDDDANDNYENDAMSVEQLKKRLRPFVDRDDDEDDRDGRKGRDRDDDKDKNRDRESLEWDL